MRTIVRLALVAPALFTACADGTAPAKPTTIAFVSAPPASFQAGTALSSISVVVKDQKGNTMSGQPLVVTVSGGSVAGSPSSTQAGPTPVGTWTLAGRVGANTITITSGALPALTASVQGIAGPPAKVSATLAAASTVGKTLSIPLSVLDAFDNAVAGVTVTLSIGGGGSLATTSAVSDASGIASVQWTLGTARGAKTLTASAAGAVGNFTTIAQADVPAAIQVVGGDNQTANAGAAIPVAPQLAVQDRFGNPTPRQNVSFNITAGGGTLTGASTVATDTDGVVVAPSWVLGKRNVPQELTASVGGVTRALTSTIHTSFSLVLRFVGTTTDAQKAIFQGAADRITALITQGGPPVVANAFPLDVGCGLTGMPPISETIDGIVIYAGIAPIDGPGKIVAESGPCGFRSSFIPAVAVVIFDSDDLASLTSGGSLEDVATHEMFHSLGYGVLWPTFSFLTGTSADPRYLGAAGRSGCALVAPPATCGAAVPVENTGGSGTALEHWRESVFGNELMTGYLNSGVNPLSTMSIMSMLDLGYAVAPTAADSYSLTALLRAPASVQAPAVPWERLHAPENSGELTPMGGLLMRPRRTP